MINSVIAQCEASFEGVVRCAVHQGALGLGPYGRLEL
jgi:hypothetical protein